VDIVFRIVGQGEIYDVIHALDVDAPAGHIRGHQDPDLAALEIFETADAAFLGDVAGKFGTVDAKAGQPLGEAPDFVAAVAEDQDSFQSLPGDDVVQEIEFLLLRDDVNNLLHRIHGNLLRLYLHHDRIHGPGGGKADDRPR